MNRHKYKSQNNRNNMQGGVLFGSIITSANVKKAALLEKIMLGSWENRMVVVQLIWKTMSN